MKNLVWQHDMDINDVFPVGYDLTDPASDEFKDFLAEMKFGQMVASLKAALSMNQATLQKNLERIIIAIGFIERRCLIMSDDLLSPKQEIVLPGQSNELDLVADEIYYYMIDARQPNDFVRAPWYLKLLKTNPLIKDISVKNAKQRIVAVLD